MFDYVLTFKACTPLLQSQHSLAVLLPGLQLSVMSCSHAVELLITILQLCYEELQLHPLLLDGCDLQISRFSLPVTHTSEKVVIIITDVHIIQLLTKRALREPRPPPWTTVDSSMIRKSQLYMPENISNEATVFLP